MLTYENKTYQFENGEKFDVLQTKMRLVLKKSKYSKKLLKKGTVKKKGAMPLPCDIVCEREVPIELRDGVRIKADVFRPASKEKVPVIIAWSPYGNDFPGMKIEGIQLSGYQKFEAPDPGYWTGHGYAVANVDIRGVNNSEGDMVHWGEQPEHLACIAPWEGFSDAYNHNTCPGGIPNYEFEMLLSHEYPGHGYRENMGKMTKRYPLMNAYWEDKRAKQNCRKISQLSIKENISFIPELKIHLGFFCP